MLLRVWVILALPLLAAAEVASGQTPQSEDAAARPAWWLRRAYVELLRYEEVPGRRQRMSRMELLGRLRDLQEVAGDRAGRIETCRLALALMYQRKEAGDLEAVLLQASPAGQMGRLNAVIHARPAGPARDAARVWAADVLVEMGDLGAAGQAAAAVDDPVERNDVLRRVVLALLSAGREREAVRLAEGMARVEVGTAKGKELATFFATLGPVQARLGERSGARRSLEVMGAGLLAGELTVTDRLRLLAGRGTTLVMMGQVNEGQTALEEMGRVVRAEGRGEVSVRALCEAMVAGPGVGVLEGFVGGLPEAQRADWWLGGAGALAERGRFEEVERLLARVPESQCGAEYERVVRRVAAEAGEVGRAVRLAGRIRDRACGVESYEGAVSLYEVILAGEGMTREVAAGLARDLMGGVSETAPAVAVKRLGVAARAALRAGDGEMAREAVRRAVAVLPKDGAGRRYLLDDVIEAQVAVGMLDEAGVLALSELPGELVGVVRAYAEAGRREEGARIVREVLAGIERASEAGVGPAVGTMELAEMAAWCGDRGVQDRALGMASAEVLSANVRGWGGNVGEWTELARVYRVAGRLAEFAGVVDRVRRASTRVQINLAVAEGLMGRG